MEPVAGFVIAGVLASVGALVLWTRHMRSEAAHAFEAAARELGLTYTKGVPGWVGGPLDGVPITGMPEPGAGGSAGYQLRVREMPATVTVTKAGFASPPDITTGDPVFDKAIRLDGEVAALLAIFDANTREVVLRRFSEFGGFLHLRDGQLVLQFRDLPTHASAVVYAIRALVEVAAAIRSRYPRKGRAECLAENAETDPIPSVRYRNLEALLEHRDAVPARRAFEAALAHGTAAARLVGAIGLRDAGALRRLAVDPAIASLQRSRAALVLAEILPDDQAETALLQILPALGDPDADIPVIERLGRIGTAKSVEVLHARAGVLTTSARAASEAIEKIQARIAGAAPGQMSLVAPHPDAGAVSLPEERAGALSPAKPKRETT